MQELTLREIQERELNLLLALQEFCQVNDLHYYLCSGTLLGAVRHQGFIPWDDDIDICMPRPDYEKLIRSFVIKNKSFKLRYNGLDGFSAPFAKLTDDNTVVQSKYSVNTIDTKLWVDIFPVDGLPNEVSILKEMYHSCNFYRKIYGLTEARLGEGKTPLHKYSKYILKPLSKLYGKKRCVRQIDKIAQQYCYENSDYVGPITWGCGRMPKSEFEKAVDVVFEGHIFSTFSCWDSYLNSLYGNYMKLPPIGKRQTHNMHVYIEN